MAGTVERVSDIEGVDPDTAELLVEPDPADAIDRDSPVCPECGWVKPETSRAPNRLAVGVHRKSVHGISGGSAHPPTGRPTGRPPKAAKDAAPRTIKVDLRQQTKAKNDPALEAVEARANQLAGVVAVMLFVAGQHADAADVETGRGQWAKSVRELAVYEAWLRKLAEGGESTGRMIAWAQFATATAGLILPILLRHGAIPAAIAQFLEGADLGAIAGQPPPPGPEANGESVAA